MTLSQPVIRGLYISTIVTLLIAIVMVQKNYVTLPDKDKVKATDQTEENHSIISVVDAIANLYLLLPAFVDPEKRSGLSLEEKKAREHEFLALLNNLPVDRIIEKMEDLELVTKEQLAAIKNKRFYINRLAEVAMNGIMTPETPETPKHGKVVFKSGLDSPLTNHFDAFNEAVFAFFDSRAYRDEAIFVKWYESSRGKMALFKQFPITQNDTNYIWIHNSDGFEKGQYRVEIYRINESFDLLSKGEFEVY